MSDPEQEKVLLEAAEWIVRTGEEDFSREDAIDLLNWREADARNNQAYLDLKGLWDDLPHMRHLAEMAPVAVNDDEPQDISWAGAWRRQAVGWVCGITAIAAATAFFLLPSLRNGPVQHFATGVAQISEVKLPDGSIATLGPKTAISVNFSGSERRLQLESGEAFFEVTKDREHPFIVVASNSIVRVVGTKFNVRLGGKSTRVAVLQGTVQVRGRDANHAVNAVEILHRGDQAEIVADSSGKARVRKSTSVDHAGKFNALAAGWREGWLVYEDARLGDIVEDINRYYAPGVELPDRGLSEVRVTASFKATKIPQFVISLEKSFPVTVVAQPNGGYSLHSSS